MVILWCLFYVLAADSYATDHLILALSCHDDLVEKVGQRPLHRAGIRNEVDECKGRRRMKGRRVVVE